MILTLDVGNTNVKAALFDGREMKHYWRMTTDRMRTSDEYGITLMSMFSHGGVTAADVTGIIYSSVVPSINFTIEHMCSTYFGIDPLALSPGMTTGLDIVYDNPRELGSDRVANAVAAWELYGGPAIVIDFGTATAFGVISSRGEFLGGAICPGLKLSSDALVERAAKLPRIELVKPETVIARNTVTNMQAGIVYGYVGQVNYIIHKMEEELNEPDVRVIATGGLARMIAAESHLIDIIDGSLTLKGLQLIYDKNAG